ncbi:kinetochore-associated protein DSN1 homolog isoform 2-T2 [Menidia menidia]
MSSVTQKTKRCSSASPTLVPPTKSPRTDSISPTAQRPDAGQEVDTDKPEMHSGPTNESISPTVRRKSWRRATITRRSLPALLNPYQALCKSISTSLPREERLEKLLEASMKLAVERTHSTLQSVPKISLESFQKQIDHIQTEWGPQFSSSSASSSGQTVKKAMESVQRAIDRLQAESESWEALLIKHRSKAEELKRTVEMGQETGSISISAPSTVQSSQYLVIQSKPDYQSVLCRQRPMLNTIAMIMDTQCKMVRELLSIKEYSQSLVKETSGRLAEEAGFQDLSSDPLRNLFSAPLQTPTA